MGACNFEEVGRGKTADEAFESLRNEYQHASIAEEGYSGTIAEKYHFITFALPKGKTPAQHARDMLHDPRLEDKWDGPAGCIAMGEGRWLFFGFAPS